jgi:hypothetical protein
MPIIYGIWADDVRLPYYGSTILTISQRKAVHKNGYKKWKKGNITKCCSFDLFHAVGFDACQFEIVERLPDDISNDDLRWRERWYIENCPCINKLIPIRTDEENVEYHRQYNETHKEEILENNRQYRETHRKELNQYWRNYYETHKEQRKEYQRRYNARKKAERIEAFKALLKTDA